MTKPVGFFEIGIFQPRTTENIGTLWRTAWQLGAAGIFTIGKKQRKQTSDILNVPYRIPMRHYDTFDDFLNARPIGARLIGVEMGGEPLAGFHHPERAIYLVGSETNGLSKQVLERCDAVVELESLNYASYNLAVAGSIVLYHRFITLGAQPG